MNGYKTVKLELPEPAYEWLHTLQHVSNTSMEQIIVMLLSETSPQKIAELSNRGRNMQ